MKARGAIGLTQTQLAANSGVSLSAIKGYETGRNMPGVRELRDLCRVLRVTPNRLLYGVEAPFPSLDAADPAKTPGDKGQSVHRGRISALVHMLSFDESFAVYTLAKAIATARFGEKEVRASLEGADLMTGLSLLQQTGKIEFDLLPKDPELLRTLADGLRNATEKGESTTIPLQVGEIGLKVSKK